MSQMSCVPFSRSAGDFAGHMAVVDAQVSLEGLLDEECFPYIFYEGQKHDDAAVLKERTDVVVGPSIPVPLPKILSDEYLRQIARGKFPATRPRQRGVGYGESAMLDLHERAVQEAAQDVVGEQGAHEQWQHEEHQHCHHARGQGDYKCCNDTADHYPAIDYEQYGIPGEPLDCHPKGLEGFVDRHAGRMGHRWALEALSRAGSCTVSRQEVAEIQQAIACTALGRHRGEIHVRGAKRTAAGVAGDVHAAIPQAASGPVPLQRSGKIVIQFA